MEKMDRSPPPRRCGSRAAIASGPDAATDEHQYDPHRRGAILLDAALRVGLVPLPLVLGRALALVCDAYHQRGRAPGRLTVRVPAEAAELLFDAPEESDMHALHVNGVGKSITDGVGTVWRHYTISHTIRGGDKPLRLYRDESAPVRFAVSFRSLSTDIGATRASSQLLDSMDTIEWAVAAGADIAMRYLDEFFTFASSSMPRDARIVARVGVRIAGRGRPFAETVNTEHWLLRAGPITRALPATHPGAAALTAHSALTVTPLPAKLRRRDGDSDIEDLAFDAPADARSGSAMSYGAWSDAQWRVARDTLDAIRGRAAAGGGFEEGVDNHPVLLALGTILWQRDALAAAAADARGGKRDSDALILPLKLDPTVVLLACDALRYAHALGLAAVAAAEDSDAGGEDDNDGNSSGTALSVPVNLADWLEMHAFKSQRYAPAMVMAPLTLAAQLVRLLQYFAVHYDGVTHTGFPVEGTLRMPLEDAPDAIGGLQYRMRLPRDAERAAEHLRGLALLVNYVELVSASSQCATNDMALLEGTVVETMLASALVETPEYERTDVDRERLCARATLPVRDTYGGSIALRGARHGDRLVHEEMLELLLAEMTTPELHTAAHQLARLFASSIESALYASMERGRDALARQARRRGSQDLAGLLGAANAADGKRASDDWGGNGESVDEGQTTSSDTAAIDVPAGGRGALDYRVLVLVDAAASGLLLDMFPGATDRWKRRDRVRAPAARAVADALVRTLARRAAADVAPVRAAIGLNVAGLLSSSVLRDVARDVGMSVLDMIRELLTVHTPALIRIAMAIFNLVPAVTAVATGVGVPVGVLGIFMSLVSIFREVVTIAGALFDQDGAAFRIIARIVRFVIGIFQRPAVKDKLPAEARRTLHSMDRGMERIDEVARAAAAQQQTPERAARPQASVDEVQALADKLPPVADVHVDTNADAIADLERQIEQLRAAQQPQAPRAVAVAAHIGTHAAMSNSHRAHAARLRMYAAESQLLRAVQAVTAAVHASVRTPEQRAAIVRYAGVCRLLTNAAIAERHTVAGSALAGRRASIGAPAGLGRLLSHPVVSAVLSETGTTVADVVGEIAKLGAAGLMKQAGTLLSLAVATLIVGVPVVGLIAVPQILHSIVSLVRQNMGIIRALLRANSLVARIFVRIMQNFVSVVSAPAISGHLSEDQLSELSEIDQFVAEALGDIPDTQQQQQPPQEQVGALAHGVAVDQAAFVRRRLSAKLAAEFPLAASEDPWGDCAPVPFLVGASADAAPDGDSGDDDDEPIPPPPTTDELDRAVEVAVGELTRAVARRGVRAAKDSARGTRRVLNRLARRVERITAGARAKLTAEQRARVALFEDEWRQMLDLAVRHARAERIAQIRTQIGHVSEAIGARPGRGGRTRPRRRAPAPRPRPVRRRHPRPGAAHALGSVLGGVLGGAAAAAAGLASGVAYGTWDAMHGGIVRGLPLELVAPRVAPALMTPEERLLAERYFVYSMLPTPHWSLRYDLLGYYDAVGRGARRRRMYRMKPHHRARI